MKITLNILAGPYAGRMFEFIDFPVSIGRMSSNNLNLPNDNYVSRAHCSIISDGNNVLIIDLKSTNGTFINNQCIVSPVIIKNDDIVTIGNTHIQCRLD